MADNHPHVSIRKFQDRPVETRKIEIILQAAMQAPTADNQQPWEFFVVSNKEKLNALSKVSPNAFLTREAPLTIVTAYRKDSLSQVYAQFYLSIVMENLWLEVDTQGLGGVWLGLAPNEERMKAVEEILALPENLSAFAMFPVGYADEERDPRQVRFESERIHWIE